MASLPTLAVRRHVPRPSATLVAAIAQASTGWIVDANGRRGALANGIRPLTRNTSFCGPAYTVRTRARDNLAAWAALAYAKPGDVLVIATDEYAESSVIGDAFVGMARNLGIAAIVTDGMVRDLAGIDATGMPVCARGLNPNSPHKDGPGELGTEIAIGGTLVRSGDIIRGDADGVVVVSADRTDAVVYELGKVQDKEKLMDSWVNDGLKAPPWLQAALGDGAVIFLDEAKT
ncbi:MAG: hypothetical protein RL682_1633 [Pseudomonadota bacterium]|jgi:4-hydroxy-4-methyl-2-oxoglutarate aldolase